MNKMKLLSKSVVGGYEWRLEEFPDGELIVSGGLQTDDGRDVNYTLTTTDRSKAVNKFYELKHKAFNIASRCSLCGGVLKEHNGVIYCDTCGNKPGV